MAQSLKHKLITGLFCLNGLLIVDGGVVAALSREPDGRKMGEKMLLTGLAGAAALTGLGALYQNIRSQPKPARRRATPHTL